MTPQRPDQVRNSVDALKRFLVRGWTMSAFLKAAAVSTSAAVSAVSPDGETFGPVNVRSAQEAADALSEWGALNIQPTRAKA